MNKLYAALTMIALALMATGGATAQTLVISPNPVTIYAQAGGSSVDTTLTFTSSDNGATAIGFSPVPSVSWITVPTAPSGGWKTPATVVVTVNPAALTAGVNSGSLLIYSTQFLSVPVNVTVSSISVSPRSINLGSYQVGSTTYPTAATLAVSGANGSFTVSKAAADTWYTAAAYGSPLSAVLVSFNPSAASSLTPSSTPLTGTLTITPGGTGGVPVNVPISLSVTASPQVTVSPSTGLSFNWQSSGTNNQTSQVLTLTSNASVPVNFSVTAPGVNWITLPSTNPTSIPAGGSTSIVVQVNGVNQQVGATTGTVQITVSGALFPNGTTALSVPVVLNISAYPLLFVTQSALTYSYQFGSPTLPASQTVTPQSSGAPTQQVTYAASVPATDSWLSVYPAGALTTGAGSFTVNVITVGLSPGTYTSKVIMTPVSNGSGQTSVSVPVILTVSFANILQVSSTQLVFPYQIGQTAPSPQTISLSSSTGAPLSYTVTAPSSAAAPWLNVSGSLSGVTDQTTFTVAIIPSAVTTASNGFLDATITVAATDPSTGLSVNTQTIDVQLYATTTPQLVVDKPGPLTFVTYPNLPSYPLSATTTINLTGTSSLPGDALTGVAITKTTATQATTGNWLGGTTPGSTTPTSFTVNGTVLNNMSAGNTYNGTITIAANGPNALVAPDTPFTIKTIFVVDAAKGIVTTPQSDGSVQFTQVQGGQAPASQLVYVSTDGVSLPFQAVVNTGVLSWLTVGAPTGPTPGSFKVSADASNLTTGVYTGAIYVTIPNAAGSPFRIPVTFTVTGGSIAASAKSLSFMQVVNGPTPASQTFQVTSSPSAVAYTVGVSPSTATWLTAVTTVGGGSTPGTVTVSVSASSLAVGQYTANVVVTSAGATGSPISIPVTLTVQQATISAPTTALTFTQLAGGAAPAAQTVQVTATPASVNFSVSTATSNGSGWLNASVGGVGTTGSTPGTVSISVNGGSLTAGPYSGTVTITSANATGSPITIPVLLNVTTAAVLTTSQTSLTFSSVLGQATTPQTVILTSSSSAPFAVTAATNSGGNWLTATPATGTAGSTAVTITVSPNTTSLAAGSYTGTVTIASTSAVSPVIINVSLAVQAIPTPVIVAVKNAASYVAGAVSPGENIYISGTGIGPSTLVGAALTTSGQLSTNIGNTQVLFDGIPAPLIYASATQTSAMVPYEIGGRTSTNIQIVFSGVQSATLPYSVTTAVPGIYTQNSQGFGPGSILNTDNTINGPNNPAAKNSVIQIYMTGEGATSPASTTGGVAASGSNTLNKPVLGVTATIGGLPATVAYYGSAPSIVYGVMQVNLVVPSGVASGAQLVVINVGNNATQANVTVAVQ